MPRSVGYLFDTLHVWQSEDIRARLAWAVEIIKPYSLPRIVAFITFLVLVFTF